MASNDDTVAEIREDVNEYLASIGPGEYPAETQFAEFADRFVAAHRREMDHRAIIAGVSLADAVDDAHKREIAAKDTEIAELRDTINMDSASMAGKDAVIAELRECLKDAVRLHCDNLDGDCLHCIRCGVCNYLKWRKALGGAE